MKVGIIAVYGDCHRHFRHQQRLFQPQIGPFERSGRVFPAAQQLVAAS